MKAVIMAGGRGTRISSLTKDIPKPMIKVGGKPVLEHEIECLRSQGFCDLIITVGYLGNIIMEYFGDGNKVSPATGKNFGVHIEYYFEKEPLGNAGALLEIREKLTEDFLLLNGDVMFEVDFTRFVNAHKKFGGLATIFTHPNSHPYDSGLVITDKQGCVQRWISKEEKRPENYKNCVNAGLHVLSPSLLDRQYPTKKVDLDRDILKPLASSGKLYAYQSSEYVKDMGTPQRYQTVCSEYISGLIRKKNLRNKQRAVFLDRDGTLNKYIGFLRKKEELELIPGVTQAIRRINESGYLAIVITNQPVIARGEVSSKELEEIHNKLETVLGKEGAYLDGIYYCPHHPDKGFPGEVAEYKIVCDCRKPKPGLLLKAAEKFNIDLCNSWMIGDGKNDILAGKAAGCKTALIGEQDMGQDITVNSLLEFVNIIIGSKRGEEGEKKVDRR